MALSVVPKCPFLSQNVPNFESINKELEIKPKNKFLVYGRGDIIIMKKLELPSSKEECEDIFKLMNKKALKISDEEIQKEITAVRKTNR